MQAYKGEGAGGDISGGAGQVQGSSKVKLTTARAGARAGGKNKISHVKLVNADLLVN